MSQDKIATRFTLVEQGENKITITVSSLHHDKVRATIFQTLLMMRNAIEDVSIDIATNNVTVSFDSQTLTQGNLLDIVNSVLNNFAQKPQNKREEGEPVEPEGVHKEIVFKVDGMSCKSCALFVEMILAKEADVLQANVDFNQGVGSVIGYLTEDEIFKIVKRNGYRPSSL